jgi:hypothetical protein
MNIFGNLKENLTSSIEDIALGKLKKHLQEKNIKGYFVTLDEKKEELITKQIDENIVLITETEYNYMKEFIKRKITNNG